MIIISIVISIKILQDLFLKAICRCLCIHLSVDIVKIRAQGNIVFVNQDYMSINIKIIYCTIDKLILCANGLTLIIQ